MSGARKCLEQGSLIRKRMNERMQLKRLTLTAMFAALCAVGGLLKIPIAIGSTALDSTPALLSAAFLPPFYAGLASGIGHTASAMYAGFPLGPFHLFIALEMLCIVAVFAWLHKAQKNTLKWVFFIVANGLLAPIPFYFLVSPAFFFGAVPSIFVATLVNAVLAAVAMPALQAVANREWGELR